MPGDADALAGLVAADRAGLRDDVPVEVAAHRLGQRRDAGDLLREVVRHGIPSPGSGIDRSRPAL